MNKRGLSAVITTLLIVLLVLVAVGIVWVVIRNMLEEGAEGIGSSASWINTDIRAVAVNCAEPENCMIIFERTGTNNDVIAGVKLVFFEGTQSSGIIDVPGNIEKLLGKVITIDSLLTSPDRLEVTPYILDASGNERFSPQITDFNVGGGSSSSGCVPDGTCDVGENCPADATDCTDNICYTPTCVNGCGEAFVVSGGIDIGCVGVCDGAGNCVECVGDGDCTVPGESCVGGSCVEETGGGIHDFTGLPLTADGWTDFETMINTPGLYDDARVIFVSNSGDDATGQIYAISGITFDANGMFQPVGAENAYATIAEGYAQIRDGYPDILLLERGDSWNEQFTPWGVGSPKPGTSPDARHIIASYGIGHRPMLLLGSNTGLSSEDGAGNFIVSGINFYSDDPANTDRSIDMLGVGQDQLYEDCVFYHNIQRVQGWGGDFGNIAFRRNQFIEGEISGGSFTLSQVLYATQGNGLLIEENMFYSPIAQNRHLYLSPNGNPECVDPNPVCNSLRGVIVRENIFYTSRDTGISYRSGGVLDNNLIVRNDLVRFGGHGGSGDSVQSGQITNNVFLESVPGSAGNGEYSLFLQNNDGTTVSGNIWTDPTGISSSSLAISINGDTNVNVARNIEVVSNIVYGWAMTGTTNRGITTSSTLADVENVHIHDNDMQMVNGASVIVLHNSYNGGTFEGFTYENNRYYSTDPDSTWFDWASTGGTFSEWVSASGETGASDTQVSYTDPDRNLKTYNLGLGGTASTEEFMLLALDQSRDSWNTDYTACAVNNYIRAGFDKASVSC